MFLPRGELILNSPKSGQRGRLSSIDTAASQAGNGSCSGTGTGTTHLNEEDLGKFRTKFCERKIIHGFCDHGGGWGCNFSHNLRWLRRNAQKQKYAPRMCATFPCCVNGLSCQYAHSREEQFFHPSVYKRLPCLSYPRLQCRLGQLCPFTHGLGDHALTVPGATNEHLSTEDLYHMVDQQTAVILHTLNLTAEKLVQAVAELELEHDPGVRSDAPFSLVSSLAGGSPFPARSRHRGSLMDVLSELNQELNMSKSTGNEDSDMPDDRFISLLKGERGFSALAPKAACGGAMDQENGKWQSICKDIVISVSSGRVGVYMGNACVVFQGRMESSSLSLSSCSLSAAFEQPSCEEDKAFRECLVVRCAKTPVLLSADSKTGGVVSPVRLETDAKNGWVGIFETEGRRSMVDWVKLEKKLEFASLSGSQFSPMYMLEDSEGNLPVVENLAEYLLVVKEDRDLLIRQYILQMIKIIQTVHENQGTVGGFSLDQWQFAAGSVDKLLLLPVNSQTGAAAGKDEDLKSLGLAVAQLLLGSVEQPVLGEKLLGQLAEQSGGLAWDFVVRCLYRPEKETCADLLRHPFLWSWTTMTSILMRGVAGWFQQSGLLFKPNAQRHLINWAENSFGCTRNEGVPVRRQVYRLSANLEWMPPVTGSQRSCVNVVATMTVGDKRASPCLVLDQTRLSLVKCPNSRSRGSGDFLLSMLPTCSTDSHLELVLPKLKCKLSGNIKLVDQLLARFHLTERTSVYSFLSFVLFALSNPHLCMDADAINKNSQAALIRRHRSAVNTILNAVPLGMLITCQLAEADNLLDPILTSGLTSPKRTRSPTTLILDGRFLN